MMAGPWRPRLNATTMLGQGKTVIQAEIDAGKKTGIDSDDFITTFINDNKMPVLIN